MIDRNLGNLKEQYKGVPFMALTATANTKVRKDILENLKMNNAVTLQQSFNRPNLYYEVRPKRGGKNLILDIYGFITAQPTGASGIIYCSSKDKCEEVAKKLREDHGLRAYHYHAGMNRSDRIMMQTEWQEHKFEIIVATVSNGRRAKLMPCRLLSGWGEHYEKSSQVLTVASIDKPDVRCKSFSRQDLGH